MAEIISGFIGWAAFSIIAGIYCHIDKGDTGIVFAIIGASYGIMMLIVAKPKH